MKKSSGLISLVQVMRLTNKSTIRRVLCDRGRYLSSCLLHYTTRFQVRGTYGCHAGDALSIGSDEAFFRSLVTAFLGEKTRLRADFIKACCRK